MFAGVNKMCDCLLKCSVSSVYNQGLLWNRLAICLLLDAHCFIKLLFGKKCL